MSVSILVPQESLRSILPSKRLKPYRITPSQGVLTITAYEYRESDIDPYNEVSISVPVTMDVNTPLFTGSLRKLPKVPLVYIHRLPVTTEIAREVGADFAGYPKFIADIEYTENERWLTCELKAGDHHILTLTGRKLALVKRPRTRVKPLTHRRGYLLRSEFVLSETEIGYSKGGGDVKLELGDHDIALELENLGLGKTLGYQYCPHIKGILTPVFESYPI